MFDEFGFEHLIPFIKGAGFTILLCASSLLFGSLIGLLAGIAATSTNKLARWVSKTYTNLIRGLPLLIILFFIYFGFPIFFEGISFSKSFTAIVSLSIYSGAYLGEIVRGSINSIHLGQWDASDALGLSYLQKMRFVIFPQALKVIIPPGIGFFIALVKDSSLVSVIGYVDLTKAGKIVSSLTLNPLLSYSIIAVFYFFICFTLSKVSVMYEKRLVK